MGKDLDNRREQAAKAIRTMDKAALLEAIKEFDGHTIFEASVMAPFPEPVRAMFVNEHKSGEDYKSSIYSNKTGERLDAMVGVYGLDVLRFIVKVLGLPEPTAMGRGFQAQQCHTVINAWAKQ